MAEDSAVIGYLVDEVLNIQPPDVRDVLLSTSILEHVSANAAADLTGNEQAAGILMNLVRTNAFVRPGLDRASAAPGICCACAFRWPA